jgi:hypothetical protein
MGLEGFVPAALMAQARMPPCADVCYWRMLTYADVCCRVRAGGADGAGSASGFIRVYMSARSNQPALLPQVELPHGGMYVSMYVCVCVC